MATNWVESTFEKLKEQGLAQVAYVPDAGHSQMIRLCEADPTIRTVSLTTEEEGVAMLAGAWLGGQRGALLIQSSGVGNCINMLAMIHECRIPLLMIVTMRGDWGEFNPWQLPMGQSTERALQGAGMVVHRVESADEVTGTVRAAAMMAFNANRAVAVLISQKVLGIKDFKK